MFNWTPECTQAVQRLKDIVTLEPLLQLPDQDKQFILEVDASQYAMGAILYQVDQKQVDRRNHLVLRPCGYHLQTFSATEQRYPIYNREYLAIMRGLRNWEYLLKYTKEPIIILTDHKNLEYYSEPHRLSNRVAGYNNE
jgi:hypothetical protein